MVSSPPLPSSGSRCPAETQRSVVPGLGRELSSLAAASNDRQPPPRMSPGPASAGLARRQPAAEPSIPSFPLAHHQHVVPPTHAMKSIEPPSLPPRRKSDRKFTSRKTPRPQTSRSATKSSVSDRVRDLASIRARLKTTERRCQLSVIGRQYRPTRTVTSSEIRVQAEVLPPPKRQRPSPFVEARPHRKSGCPLSLKLKFSRSRTSEGPQLLKPRSKKYRREFWAIIDGHGDLSFFRRARAAVPRGFYAGQSGPPPLPERLSPWKGAARGQPVTLTGRAVVWASFCKRSLPDQGFYETRERNFTTPAKKSRPLGGRPLVSVRVGRWPTLPLVLYWRIFDTRPAPDACGRPRGCEAQAVFHLRSARSAHLELLGLSLPASPSSVPFGSAPCRSRPVVPEIELAPVVRGRRV